ncbi:MAG: hypothetical protein J6Z45_07350, partial [Oscillospiraceae bacterium]|nr:hypothetical protein [Oscillospiraceae bacterium]
VPSYLEICGVRVTSANQANVLGDGVFKYTPSTNTLTIKGTGSYSSVDYLIYSTLDDLTVKIAADTNLSAENAEIEFYGNTVITGPGKLVSTARIYTENHLTIRDADITINDDDHSTAIYATELTLDNVILDLTANYNALNGSTIYYDSDNLMVVSPAGGYIDDSYYCVKDGDDNQSNTAVIVPAYKLWVKGAVDTDSNKVNYYNYSDILGDGGSLSYDPANKVLNINGNLQFQSDDFRNTFIMSSIEGLTIKVNGNYTWNVPCYELFRFYEDTTITGTGSLTWSYLDSDNDNGIYLSDDYTSNPTLTIDGVTLNLSSYSTTLLGSGSNLVINGATLVLRSRYSYAIESMSDITLSNCELTVPAEGVIADGTVWEDDLMSKRAQRVTIEGKANMADAVVTLSKTKFPYTGNQVKVGSYISVTYNGTKLKYGTDFTMTYSNNTNLGVKTAKVTVKGIGKYSGSKAAYYSILPVQQAKPALTLKNGKINVSWASDPNAQGYQVQYSKDSGYSSYKLLAYATRTSCELPEPALGEKWYVRVRSYLKNGTSKEGIWSSNSSITVTAPVDSVSLSKTSFAYTGNQVKVGSYITVKSGDTKLKYNTDFTMTYENNIECGASTAKVIVKGIGKYSGTITKKYTIYPAQQAAPKLSTVSGKLHIVWTKDTNAQGYQVQYCRSSDFTGTTLKTVAYATKTACDAAEPVVGELWYVRVRAYVKNSSGTKYGTWSSPSTLKVGKLSTVTLSKSEFAYTGSQVKVGNYITVKSGNQKLKYGTEFTMTYKNNVNKGTATVTVTGIGEYSGSISKTYTIK